MAQGATGSDWTDDENDLIVADYFAMLGEELADRPYVKARHNAAIVAATGRSRGSVERKFMNVSAVLVRLGLPRIKGYVPAVNAQFGPLTAAIDRYLGANPKVLDPVVPDRAPGPMSGLFVPPPPFDPSSDVTPEPIRRLARKFDPRWSGSRASPWGGSAPPRRWRRSSGTRRCRQ